MPKIEVNVELCKGCRLCIGVCPQNIIKTGDYANSQGYRPAEQYRAEECTGCGLCAVICPDAAIEVYK
ncbi:MAG: 4Fe-4S binding protein [Peptococcaceae bacterium]|jgi:2-oxoglutarate ferredoxin oxidoreductase subunit delta|nr:4Fe-4S binding protein [Peptococcaceae bacterium]MDH7526353.1 4Fe-4S binding protein [Peptococcaceae bacterium]